VRLTKFTDFSLRVLLFAAAPPTERVTIESAAESFDISRAHLKKVVLALTRGGFLRGIRGRSGGFELAHTPDQINLGAVLRLTEPDFGLFECYLTGNTCTISRPCRLPSVATEALLAFLSVFDSHTLADVLVRPEYFLPQQEKRKQPIRGPKLALA
jgi:Rrf2 family nitric oxide-sensitive transcriptional repressor